MYDHITTHALNNVWCNPDQDRQHIFKLHRITPKTGVITNVYVMLRTITLPTAKDKYHVFQVGHLSPLLLNLLGKTPGWQTSTWISLSEAMNNKIMYTNLYNDKGVQLPRFQNYYMVTPDGTLLFAIREIKKIPIDYLNDNIYVRVYSNAYFNLAPNAEEHKITVKGLVYKESSDFVKYQNEYNQHVAKNGATLAFKNGLLINEIKLAGTAKGDVFEWVYDSSAETMVDIKVSYMQNFESILDGKSKLLFNYKSEGMAKIIYQDDVDFYMWSARTNTPSNGLYYHKNTADACRMVTHCAYSLLAQHVATQSRYLEELTGQPGLNKDELYIKAIIRKSAYNRPLIYDHNRIFELYKLPSDRIEQALLGVNATVPFWKAENLENSAYCALMRAYPEELTKQLVQNAYGFNGMAKVLADTPLVTKTMGVSKYIDVPVGVRLNSTFFEYDSSGILKGFYNHNGAETYICKNNNIKYVEIITGQGTKTPDMRFTKNTVDLPNNLNYRVYKIHDTNNTVTDVTNTPIYSVSKGRLSTSLEGTTHSLVVKTDSKFLCYETEITPTTGDFSFTLVENENRDGTTKQYALRFPPRYWDIFLNGKMLIEGIDYLVKFPKVHIISKAHILQPAVNTPQKITVRAVGFCNPDLSWKTTDMVGFIEHGFLLNNSKYDIEDDKVQHISVAGCLKHKSEVLFSDEHTGISIANNSNGLPYRVNNTYVSLSAYTTVNSQDLMEEAETNDATISAYLTSKLPEPERDGLSAIQKRYDLYSPFISALLEDLQTGLLDTDIGAQNLTDVRVVEICSKYERILAYDPTQPEYPIDQRYLVIQPTIRTGVVNLTVLQYRFIRKVVELYCHGTLNLAETVTFS